MKTEKITVYDPNMGEMTIGIDEQGVARRFRVVMPLKEKEEIIPIQGKPFLGVRAMDKLNRVAGLNVLTPASVNVDGKQRPNPYIERDENGIPRAVTVRKIAIGNGPTGQLIATDYVLTYNRHSLLLQSLAKAADQKPGACFLGTREEDPKEKEVEIEVSEWRTSKNGKSYKATGGNKKIGGGGRWYFFPLDDTLGYWADLSSTAVQEVMKDYTTILTTFERRAQSICRRNAMAHHPAIGGAYAEKDEEGNYVKTVYGIRYEKDPAHFQEALQEIQSGKAIEKVLDAEVIEVEDDTPSPEEVTLMAKEATPDLDELVPEPPEPQAQPAKPKKTAKKEEIRDEDVPF